MHNQKTKTLEMIQINPKSAPVASVIWLHGLGADGNDFVPIVPELNLPPHLPIRFVFPHAPMQPVTINNGYVMRAWYDIVSIESNTHADLAGIQQSAQAIHQLIEEEVERGIPHEKIILAGFSQGAVIALTTGLMFPKKLAGIIALSGYLPFASHVFAQASPSNQSIPIFIAHGREDNIVPFYLGQKLEQMLKEHHYTVNWHSYPMPHSVCLEEILEIGRWISALPLTK